MMGPLEILSLLFVCLLGGMQDVVVEEDSLESTQIYYMRWGIIYSMIFGIKGLFLWLMNLKQQGFNQRMLFSAIYSA